MLDQVLGAVATLVGQAVQDCGGPVGRVMRYHCRAPADCCDDMVAVAWEDLRPGVDRCDSPLRVRLRAQWRTCWPAPDVGPSGSMILDDAAVDAAASLIARVADCVAREIAGWGCNPPTMLASLAACQTLRIEQVLPACPQGGCAGVDWMLSLTIR